MACPPSSSCITSGYSNTKFSLPSAFSLRSRILSSNVQSRWRTHRGIGLSFQPKTGSLARKSQLPARVFCLHDTRAAVVTADSWDELILKSDTPVLVEFYASWCGPCRMVHRVIDEIAAEYSGKLKFFVLHADDDTRIAEDYDIKAVPVVLLFRNGKKRESVIGTMPKEFYKAAIERVLAS